jgi:hypothetical protein
MKRGNIIILSQNGELEPWGSLTDLCENRPDLSYSYLKSKSFPFDYKGINFQKKPFRAKNELIKSK